MDQRGQSHGFPGGVVYGSELADDAFNGGAGGSPTAKTLVEMRNFTNGLQEVPSLANLPFLKKINQTRLNTAIVAHNSELWAQTLGRALAINIKAWGFSEWVKSLKMWSWFSMKNPLVDRIPLPNWA